MQPVRIQLVRRFPHARDAAYEWLTDFEDGDAERAGAVVEMRRVTVREKDRVVYEGETAVLGVRAWSATEVRFSPPGAWRADVTEGPRKGSWTEYALVPDGNGARLTVTYHFVIRPAVRMAALRVLRPLVKRELEKMWDGFGQAMEKDLAPVTARTASPRP